MDYTEILTHFETYDPKLMLGHICWYSISDTRIEYQQLVAKLHETGLDKFIIPPPPRPSDVFKRMCTRNQIKNVPGPDADHKFNYMIREVDKDRDSIWRTIVRETIDSQNRKLGYIELITLHFDREAEGVSLENKVWDPTAVTIAERVMSDYEEWKDALAAYNLRELVRHMFQALKATTIRPSGGVYFVNVERIEEVKALRSLVNDWPGCSLVAFPLLNDKEEREMLKKAFEDESIEVIDRTIADMTDVIKSGKKITPNRYADLVGDFNAIRDKVGEYSDLLDDALHAAGSRVQVYEAQLVKLMESVK